MTTPAAFAVASVLHAGFQVTVTALVYPALAEVGADEWEVAHARHSRRIVPLVATGYAALLVTGGALLLDGPDRAGWVGVAGAAGAMALTASVAAPTHGRLTRHDAALLRRLLRVDRVRCACALVGAAAAVRGVTR